jgi:[acyl-carrier-protein] S-malonyltransferase
VKAIAFLFPGQGSQKVGMGQDLYEALETVRDIFEMACEVTRMHLDRLCFRGPMEELTRTAHLQPAITAVNLACLAPLIQEGVRPAVVAGHSLGEYSALHAAGTVSAPDTFRLVHERGRLMHRESLRHKGAMCALIGLSIEAVQDLVRRHAAAGVVSVANHNTETQIVITGSPEAVEAASEEAGALGAKAVPLNVSGAWHSELIRGSVEEFRAFLSAVPFGKPQIPVVMNVTADYGKEPEAIRGHMAEQLCRPVRWYASIRRLLEEGIDTFVEVGPGRVLTGLLRKIAPADAAIRSHSVGDLRGLEKTLKAIA